MKIVKLLYTFFLPFLCSGRTRHRHHLPKHHHSYDCSRRIQCSLIPINIISVKKAFLQYVSKPNIVLVRFKLTIVGYNDSVLEEQPFMRSHPFASEWIWAREGSGSRILSLPHDADVLSFHSLEASGPINIRFSTWPSLCLYLLSPNCRIHALRQVLLANITSGTPDGKHLVCHRQVKHSNERSYLVWSCCDSELWKKKEYSCAPSETTFVVFRTLEVIIQIVSTIITLFSPLFLLKMKMWLTFDNITKFFKASLKHGITGQRNYVIRISSRQLVNLSDKKPFSLPRILIRLLLHCYGEGRCCIHWWGNWKNQPSACKSHSLSRKFWDFTWRIFALFFIYPAFFYIIYIIYTPKLEYYSKLVDMVSDLRVNYAVFPFLPNYYTTAAVWLSFSELAFIFTLLLLAWPRYPLERSLISSKQKCKRSVDHILYENMSKGYKTVLQKLTYGDSRSQRHLLSIKCFPVGCRRLSTLIRNILIQLPVLNVCFSIASNQTTYFLGSPKKTRKQACAWPGWFLIIKGMAAGILWFMHIILLAGYCTAVWLICQLALTILLYICIGSILHSATVLPWLAAIAVAVFYLNDSLSKVNQDHQLILRLIDENSPRISAAEDSEQDFTKREEDNGGLLRTHNLGAVKFIDGERGEYVSKELYYNVCEELKYGWKRSSKAIAVRMSLLLLFIVFIFGTCSVLGSLFDAGVILSVVATIASLIPKLCECWKDRGREKEKKINWSKMMPVILDKYIRVDRTACVDEDETELSTYDVRPVGLLEMDVPKVVEMRSLRLWKFPWLVSADQQTQSNEAFVLALSNKLAAATFLCKFFARAQLLEIDLDDIQVIRQWCLLIENCILEAASKVSSIDGLPIDSIRLFPVQMQQLVSEFPAGNTVDALVDSLNRQLYDPVTRAFLLTIGNTTFALSKLDNTLFAFNSNCHGEQVTDLFGAVLLTTEFNTQNLQLAVKYLIDPYSPDAVPVYSIVPVEAFLLTSPPITPTSSSGNMESSIAQQTSL